MLYLNSLKNENYNNNDYVFNDIINFHFAIKLLNIRRIKIYYSILARMYL